MGWLAVFLEKIKGLNGVVIYYIGIDFNFHDSWYELFNEKRSIFFRTNLFFRGYIWKSEVLK